MNITLLFFYLLCIIYCIILYDAFYTISIIDINQTPNTWVLHSIMSLISFWSDLSHTRIFIAYPCNMLYFYFPNHHFFFTKITFIISLFALFPIQTQALTKLMDFLSICLCICLTLKVDSLWISPSLNGCLECDFCLGPSPGH